MVIMNMLRNVLVAVLFSGLGFNAFGMKKNIKKIEKKRSIKRKQNVTDNVTNIVCACAKKDVFDFCDCDSKTISKKRKYFLTKKKPQKKSTDNESSSSNDFIFTTPPRNEKKKVVFESPLNVTKKITNTLKALVIILKNNTDEVTANEQAKQVADRLNIFYKSLSTDDRIKDVRFYLTLFQLIFVELNEGNESKVITQIIENELGHIVGGYVGTLLKTPKANFMVEFRLKAQDEKLDGSTFCLPHLDDQDTNCHIISMKMDREYSTETTKNGENKECEKNGPLIFEQNTLSKNDMKGIKEADRKRLKTFSKVLELQNYDDMQAKVLPRKILDLFRGKSGLDTKSLKKFMLDLYNRIDKDLRVLRNSEMPKKLQVKGRRYEPERFYQLAFACMLKFIWGATTEVEIPTGEGRTDIVIHTTNKIYIIEFKYNQGWEKMPVNGIEKKLYGTAVALQQIKNKKYCELFLSHEKPVEMLGINVVHKNGVLDVEISECEKFNYSRVTIQKSDDFLKNRIKY